MSFKQIIFVFIFFAFELQAAVTERFEFYNGVRSMALGGASVAIVNDETALITNPAALGRLRDYFITVADPEVEMNDKTIGLVGYGLLNATDPQEVADDLAAAPEKYYYYRHQLFPSLVLPNFGFGFLGKSRVAAKTSTDQTLLEVDYQKDYAFIFGFNFRLWDGRIKLGFNTRIVDRTEIKKSDIPIAATDLSVDSLAKEGIGIGSDIGWLLTMPWAWLPTLGVVYRDVGTTKFDFRDGLFTKATEYPDSQRPTLDVALAISPMLGNRTRSTFTVELQDALYDADKYGKENLVRRSHLGYEVNFMDALFFRLGLNQNYLTYGLEVAVFSYQFQMASYGEDIGTSESPKEDRRFVAKLSYRF